MVGVCFEVWCVGFEFWFAVSLGVSRFVPCFGLLLVGFRIMTFFLG